MRQKLGWTAAVVLAVAGTIVLVKALNPTAPDEAEERLRNDTVPAPMIFTLGLLLVAAVLPIVLLIWKRTRAAIAVGAVAAVAALVAGGPLASATVDRVTAVGVASTIDEHPMAGTGNYLPTGPGPGPHQAWSTAETLAVPLLVPGRNLVVLLGGQDGVTVLDAATGQRRWHWRATNTGHLTGSFEFSPSVAVDAEGGRLAVVGSSVVVVLDLTTGRTLRRTALPGDWELIGRSDRHGPVPTGSFVLLSTPAGADARRVVALDLGSGELSEVDRGPAVKCAYTVADPVVTAWQPASGTVLVRAGLDCGLPQVTYLDGRGAVTARVSVPDATRCADTCFAQSVQVYGSTVAFWLESGHDDVLVWVRPDGEAVRFHGAAHAKALTVLPGADPAALRLVVELEQGEHEVVDVRGGQTVATDVAVPGIRRGVVGTTADGHPVWYRLTADNEVVLVDPGTLRQLGPATAPISGDVIGTADGRLLAGPTGRFTAPVQVLI